MHELQILNQFVDSKKLIYIAVKTNKNTETLMQS